VYTPGYENYNTSSSNPKYYEYVDSYGLSLCYITTKRDCPTSINGQTGIKAGIKGCGNGYNGIAPANAWVHTPTQLPSSALAYNIISKTGWNGDIPSDSIYAYSGNDKCGTCTPRACPTGYATSVEGCRQNANNTNEGWHLGEAHTTYSYGTTPCYKCEADPCPTTETTKSATSAAGCGTTGASGWKTLSWLKAKKIVNGTLTDQIAYSGANVCYMCLPVGTCTETDSKHYVPTPNPLGQGMVTSCGISQSKGWTVDETDQCSVGDTTFVACNKKACPEGQYASVSSCGSGAWELSYTNNYSGDDQCGTCTPKKCAQGYGTESDKSKCGIIGMGGDKSGWNINTNGTANGKSGSETCYPCVAKSACETAYHKIGKDCRHDQYSVAEAVSWYDTSGDSIISGYRGDDPCSWCITARGGSSWVSNGRTYYSGLSRGFMYDYSDDHAGLAMCGKSGPAAWKKGSYDSNGNWGYIYRCEALSCPSGSSPSQTVANCGTQGAKRWELGIATRNVSGYGTINAYTEPTYSDYYDDRPCLTCVAKQCPACASYNGGVKCIAKYSDSQPCGDNNWWVEDTSYFNTYGYYSGDKPCIRCVYKWRNYPSGGSWSAYSPETCNIEHPNGYYFTKKSSQYANCVGRDCRSGITNAQMQTILDAGYYTISPNLAAQSADAVYGSGSHTRNETCQKWNCQSGYCGVSGGCLTQIDADCQVTDKGTGYVMQNQCTSRGQLPNGECSDVRTAYKSFVCADNYCRQPGDDGSLGNNDDLCVPTNSERCAIDSGFLGRACKKTYNVGVCTSTYGYLSSAPANGFLITDNGALCEETHTGSNGNCSDVSFYEWNCNDGYGRNYTAGTCDPCPANQCSSNGTCLDIIAPQLSTVTTESGTYNYCYYLTTGEVVSREYAGSSCRNMEILDGTLITTYSMQGRLRDTHGRCVTRTYTVGTTCPSELPCRCYYGYTGGVYLYQCVSSYSVCRYYGGSSCS
ncbi:MAG: hypothetical protein J6X42_00895, partial [Alphaproteobacteria bacterium]|nr:hypothetical protein [Alphaproteobacteria bacterium]